MGAAKKAIFIAAFTLVSCSNQVVPAATPTTNTTRLRLHATTATAPLLRDLSAEYTRTRSDLVFEIGTSNYDVLAARSAADDVPYFLSNHLAADSPLWAAPVGQDGIAIVVHPDNTVPDLTTEQIRDMYRGRITHWDMVGGTATPISVVSREAGSGTRAEFERLVMGERATVQSALIAPSSEAMLDSVVTSKDRIGYISAGFIREHNAVRTLAVDGVAPTRSAIMNNAYPLRSTLFIVGQGEPDGATRAFIAWVQSQAGQSVVGRQYAPLRSP
jgi:phosphate transport system substrate-binding protein